MSCLLLVWNTACGVGQEILRRLWVWETEQARAAFLFAAEVFSNERFAFNFFWTSFYRWQRWRVTLTLLFRALILLQRHVLFYNFSLSTGENYIFTGFMLWSINAITIKTWHMPLTNYFHPGIATSYSLVLLHLCLQTISHEEKHQLCGVETPTAELPLHKNLQHISSDLLPSISPHKSILD